MREKGGPSIEGVRGSANEYIIKSPSGINVGSFVIFDMNKESKRCSLRINYFKDSLQELLKGALDSILSSIFRDSSIHKINIYVREEIQVEAFFSCGMTLQGLLTDNVFYKGEFYDEMVFGIDLLTFNSLRLNRSMSVNGVEGPQGEDFTLKILTPQNASELLDYYIRNREHLRGFEPARDESYYTLETQKRLIGESYRQFLNGTTQDFGIFLRGQLIGKIKLSNIVYGVFKSGVVGYSIDKAQQGKGYMKRALQLLVDYAFGELDLHRIEASTLVDNLKSQGVLKSCGFRELGLNEKYLYINGKWQDHITFYLIK